MAPDPSNPADLPASWLPGASQPTPKPAGYRRAVARKIKNDRHAKVLAMANVLEGAMRANLEDPWRDHYLAGTATMPDSWWRDLAAASGHPCRKVSPETRAAVVDKVRADLAAPYRAKGRG